ncbi:MAG TPA: hypothetical protein VK699_04335 [Terriglobales bacterium]|nr:hypothetical protein [Terriglobales bacterium]
MRHQRNSRILQLLACSALLLLCAAPVHAEECCAHGELQSTVPSLEHGYQLAYNLDFAAAQQEFAAWQKLHPENALGPVSEAAGLLFSEFDRLGILESQLFTKDSNFEKRKKPVPDPALRDRFEAALLRADALAKSQLEKDPNNTDALFAQALTNGLRADYTALIEKRNIASLGYTKDANVAAKKLLKINPQYYDAYLATGLNDYIVGSLSAPVRWFLHVGGYEGDKKTGISELKLAAEHGRFFAPFARMLLAVTYIRDKDPSRARELLAGLREQFPANPLFAREIARLDHNHGTGGE